MLSYEAEETENAGIIHLVRKYGGWLKLSISLVGFIDKV